MNPQPEFLPMDEDDDDKYSDCPACGRTYDDADADFLICHHCGYDAEKKQFNAKHKSRSMKGFGIDPDVTLDF